MKAATRNHAAILVRDVAAVEIGAELRQGAVTANGQGEAWPVGKGQRVGLYGNRSGPG